MVSVNLQVKELGEFLQCCRERSRAPFLMLMVEELGMKLIFRDGRAFVDLRSINQDKLTEYMETHNPFN